MQLSKLLEKQCNAAFCLKFLSTLLHHSPLRCCSRCCSRGSLLSPVISRPSPRNFSPPRSRAAVAAHLSTLASLSPKFRYRTHRTTSTESGGRVFAFSLPPPLPSSVTGSAAGREVTRSPPCLAASIVSAHSDDDEELSSSGSFGDLGSHISVTATVGRALKMGTSFLEDLDNCRLNSALQFFNT